MADTSLPEQPVTGTDRFWPIYGKVVLFTSAAFVLLIAVVSDMAPLFENSDYTSCLYVGAKLFASHRFTEMYAPYNATDFYHTPCDLAAHNLLPHLTPEHISLYNYCPLVAWLLAPLSYLSPSYSLMAWQSISLAGLIASVMILVKGWHKRLVALSSSLVFFPIACTLWIGQMDLVFGVLFFALGYRLLINRKSFPSGLMFAIACLKPQMVLVPAFLSVILVLKRNWQFALGFTCGIALLIAFNLAVGGPELFSSWLWNVRLCEKVFTDPHSGLAQYLIISIPGILLLTVFKQPLPWVKPTIYLIDLLVIFSVIWTIWRYSKLHPQSQSYIAYSVILALLTMPMVIPNYLYYDFSTLLVAALISLDKSFQEESRIPSLFLIVPMIALLNIYGVLFLVNKAFVIPAVPLIFLIIVLRRVAMASSMKQA